MSTIPALKAIAFHQPTPTGRAFKPHLVGSAPARFLSINTSRQLPAIERSALFAAQEKLAQITSLLTAKGQVSGLHQILLDKLAPEQLTQTMSRLTTEQLGWIGQKLIEVTEEGVARRAFALKQYVAFFDQANQEGGRLLASEDMVQLFTREKPSWVLAVSSQGEGAERTLSVLYKNGNVVRSRPGIDKIDFRKGSWRVSPSDYTTAEWVDQVLDQLIRDHHQTKADNSLYIRCSQKRAEVLGQGKLTGRVWFSLLHRYASEFSNEKKALATHQSTWLVGKIVELGIAVRDQATGNLSWAKTPTEADIPDPALFEKIAQVWRNDPVNMVLVRCELSREKYLAVLNEFWARIGARQLEGFHRLDNKQNEKMIAKIEKGAPNVAISDPEFLGQFSVELLN